VGVVVLTIPSTKLAPEFFDLAYLKLQLPFQPGGILTETGVEFDPLVERAEETRGERQETLDPPLNRGAGLSLTESDSHRNLQ
jgi:hypothetical protein